MNRHRTNRAVLATALTLALTALGCEGEKQPPPDSSETDMPGDQTDPPTNAGDDESVADRTIAPGEVHEWPPVSLDSSGGSHIVVVQAPDPGWSVELDGVETLPAGQRAYITIWRPEPGQMFPQVITERRTDTEVATDAPLEVVARLRTPGDAEEPAYTVVELR